jgi:phosphoenolpyruvate mutase
MRNTIQKMDSLGSLRIGHLRQLMESKDIVRILEAHNGLTALIVENARIRKDDQELEFDGVWEGSLTDAISKGMPDIAVIDMTSRLHTVQEIMAVTTKPIIIDADNGGLAEIFAFTVRRLERIGVSAVIVEDKIGKKRNSLHSDKIYQQQDSIENFSHKIRVGKASQISPDFMIIARIESLVCNMGMDDALARAQAYAQAGADAIMIHSKHKTADEIMIFCMRYHELGLKLPLVVVPTTYNSVTEAELINAGVKVVIYANHLLRSAYPVMKLVAEEILQNGRSLETDEQCMPMPELLELIPLNQADKV